MTSDWTLKPKRVWRQEVNLASSIMYYSVGKMVKRKSCFSTRVRKCVMTFSEPEQNPSGVEDQQRLGQEEQTSSESDESGDRDLSIEEEARVEARLQRFIEEQTDAGNVPDRATLHTVRAILKFKVRQGDESRVVTPSSSPVAKTASTSPTASTSTSTSRMPVRENDTTDSGAVVKEGRLPKISGIYDARGFCYGPLGSDLTVTPTSTTSSRQFFTTEGGNEASGKAINFVVVELLVPFNFAVGY
jgi:hypothetical protein